MEIIRAISVDLGENLVFCLAYQYHTEKTKSRYAWAAVRQRGQPPCDTSTLTVEHRE